MADRRSSPSGVALAPDRNPSVVPSWPLIAQAGKGIHATPPRNRLSTYNDASEGLRTRPTRSCRTEGLWRAICLSLHSLRAIFERGGGKDP
jgi:hypothetical protein